MFILPTLRIYRVCINGFNGVGKRARWFCLLTAFLSVNIYLSEVIICIANICNLLSGLHLSCLHRWNAQVYNQRVAQ